MLVVVSDEASQIAYSCSSKGKDIVCMQNSAIPTTGRIIGW